VRVEQNKEKEKERGERETEVYSPAIFSTNGDKRRETRFGKSFNFIFQARERSKTRDRLGIQL